MDSTRLLAHFIARTHYDEIPEPVVTGMKALMIDWFGSVLAGQHFYPINLFKQYARVMGPDSGSSTIFGETYKSSPYFAAFLNGASGHLLEQDDLHNSSVFHPATVVFPALFAAAEDLNCSGKEVLEAAVVGYEAGIRIGEFLGTSHYQIFHTTSTVGSISAAIAVGKLMNFDQEQVLNLIGNAATQSAGLWAFLEDAADSKQLHTAKANANGILAAYMTREGLKGARNALEGLQGLANGMSQNADADCLADALGQRWATIETSFKFHASCRHTHPASDALLSLMQEQQLTYKDIVHVKAFVHQAAIDVLGPITDPKTIHQSKFSMGTVMGLLAVYGKAGLDEFSQYALTDARVIDFRKKVEMILDRDVNQAYPKEWHGKVEVMTVSGKSYQHFLRYPKGDPENALTNEELEGKFLNLLKFTNDSSLLDKGGVILEALWNIDNVKEISEITTII